MLRRAFSTILLCAVVLFPALLLSQGAIITGKVTGESGEPLAGANVFIELTNLGSATDESGAYQFTVPADIVQDQEIDLVARFIGYKTKTVKVKLTAGTIKQDYQLREDVLKMDAIVVTGVMTETPREKLAFTVATVSDEQIEMAPAVNAVSGLRGKVAGVKVVQGSGTPGTGVSVALRGQTSLTKTSQPLYVVDGVILGANQVDIDALDIESIEVVKGAAAASIWGSRAQNGIISIKTKRGTNLGLNQTRFTIRSEFGINKIPYKQLNSQHHEFKIKDGQFVDDAGNPVDFGDAVLDDDAGYTFQDKAFPPPTYDHIKLFFDPGNFYRNSATISHNSAATNYRFALGQVREQGAVSGLEGYKRYNARLNFDHHIAPGLQLNFTGYYAGSTRDDGQSAAPNPFFGLMFMNPNADLLAPNDDGTPFKIQPDPRTLEENPLYATHNAEIAYDRQRIQSSIGLRWAPVRWFDLSSNFSFDRSDRLRERYYFRGFKTIDGGLNTGQYDKLESHDQAINADVTGTFTKAFGELTTRGQLRYLVERTEFANTYAWGQDLTVNQVRDLGVVQGDKDINSAFEEVRSAGYYGIFGLDYRDRYIADFLVRRDGSSLFGPENRWNTYFRVSGAYRMSQESWWFAPTAINEFKLRYSLGTAGGRPSFQDQYETFTVSSGNVSKGNLGNKTLKPERATEQEIGIDMVFYDRLSLQLTYATTLIEDQLLNVPLAGYFGFSNRWQNAGTLKNNTWEATLDASVLRSRDMSWNFSIVFDRTRQEITEFDLPAYRYGPGTAFYNRKGEVFGAMYGRLWMTDKGELATHNGGIHANSLDQFDVNDDGLLVPVGSGNTYRDGVSENLWGTKIEIDGVSYDWGFPVGYINEEGSDFVRIGTVIPDFNMGFSTTFRWKGFAAYFQLDSEIGGDIYNNTRQWGYREFRNIDVDQFGKAEESKKPIDYYAELYNVNAVNSWFIEDGTYLKLRELNFSYTFNRMQMAGFLGGFIKQFQFGVIGRNLLTFSGYKGFDPEVGQGDATLLRYDGFGYPNYRTFTGYIEFEL